MARPSICVPGFAVFVVASAQSFDWHRYTKWDATGYLKGPADAKLSDYVQQYVEAYSNTHKSSEQYFEDEHAGIPAAGQTALLAEAPASGQNVSDHVTEALAAEHGALQSVDASIGELRRWNAKLKEDLESKNYSMTVAQGIVTKVQSSYLGKREELTQEFSTAVEALDPATLAAANSSEVMKAEDAVRDVMEAMRRLDRTEVKAMRSALNSLEEAGKAKARRIWQEAKEAAHQAYHSGMDAARAQRKEGVHERVYEGAQGKVEEASERLLGQAEEAAERAEGFVEQESDEVEHHLETMIDELNANAGDAHEARMHRFQHQRDLVRKARMSARTQATKQEPAERESNVRKEPTSKEPAEMDFAQRESIPDQPGQKGPASKPEPSPLIVLAAAPAGEQNASDPVGEAQAAQREASLRAEAIIEQLRRWHDRLKQEAKDNNFSSTVAQGIVTKVQTAYLGKRAKLRHSFDAAMEALNATALSTANSSVVNKAEKAVRDIMEEFKHLDRAEAHAMRLTLHSTEKADKERARTFREEAKEAAHQAYRSGMAAAEAQHKVGVHRRVYEGAQRSTRAASERLHREAEEAAESVERTVERQFREAEHHLERMTDDLGDEARDVREARKQRFHRAKDLVELARRDARREAVRREPSGRGASDAERAGAGAFLAARDSREGGAALPVALACALAAALASALLAFRSCRRTPDIERPLLG